MTTTTPTGGDGALADVAARFTDDHFTFESLRTRREEPDGLDDVRGTWAEIGALGWAGMLVPAHLGGGDASWADLGVVLRALGRSLAVTPMVATGVVATIVLAADADRFGDVLAEIAAGAACVALAHDESAHFREAAVATTAHPSSEGFVLEGAKEHVVLGPVADRWLVSARRVAPDAPGEAVALFLVDPGAPGVVRSDGMLIDGRPVSRVRFDHTPLVRDALVTDSRVVLEDALVAGALAEAVAMAGGARRALELTVAYLATREQFGVPIGAFQALQHRAARLHCEVTLAEALAARALDARDAGEPKAPRLAHASKARLSETYLHVAEEGVQMHGGIGMTDETEIGFHLAAARVAAMELGDARHHRRCYAELAGY